MVSPAQPNDEYIRAPESTAPAISPSDLDQTGSQLGSAPNPVSNGIVNAEVPAEPPQTIVPPATEMKTDSIENILLSKGYVDNEQFELARAESINTGKDIADVMLEREYATDEQIAEAKSLYYKIDFVKLNEIGVAPEAVATISEGVAQRYSMLPFALDKKNNILSVAMANPLDLRAIDFVEKKSGYQIKPFLTTKANLGTIITERYSQSLSSEVTEALKDTGAATKKIVDVRNLGEVIREAPIAKIVETILTFALKSRASDVHIEPQENKTRVRYRIDGILHEKLVLPKGVQEAVVSRIKILADLKIDEKRVPQDGRFSFALGSEEVDLRVSTLPTVHGEKIVMRLLKKAQKAPSLTDLGLRGLALKYLEKSILVPNGIILITGPTGSGKTTTLYSILNRINTPKVNIVTIEDPVEYEVGGVNQVQVNPKAGLTFASGLRSFLRQDPNIIMVGEVRDQETAELAIQASLTGHLVFSTLHTNSAAGSLPRLLDMNAEPFLLASSITCVVAQRVLRQICEHCKTEYKPEPAVVEDIKAVLGPLFEARVKQQGGDPNALVIYKGEGCSECNDTGYIGRIGIFEVLPVSEKVAKLILESAPASKIQKQAMEEGMVLMKTDGYLKVLEGLTTIEEVLRVAEVKDQSRLADVKEETKQETPAETAVI
jgi:type IV pilus assembly protein PilB